MSNRTAPALKWRLHTPSDTDRPEIHVRAVKVTTAGNVAMEDEDGIVTPIPFGDLETMVCEPKKIMATNTTATGIYIFG